MLSNFFRRLARLFFPPKCVLCRKLLTREQTDLCSRCRAETDVFPRATHKIPFTTGWTALWYYKGNVRGSLLRYKFYHARSYAGPYGRLLALRLQEEGVPEPDILTWVPISARRRRQRGYDQSALLAEALGEALGLTPAATLRKRRHTTPQSSLNNDAMRRANALGAYEVLDPAQIAGKRILLVDDIITSGATASECARMLLTAGAEEVFCAAVAARPKNNPAGRQPSGSAGFHRNF